jgi:hypothetical protein
MNLKFLKNISLFFTIITILIFILFVFGKISHSFFWIYIILIALFAYKGLPFLRKKFNL